MIYIKKYILLTINFSKKSEKKNFNHFIKGRNIINYIKQVYMFSSHLLNSINDEKFYLIYSK